MRYLPLFLQSIPLSLKTFWRYLLILPLLAIAALVVSLVGLFPIVGIFVPGTVSAGLVIMGLRCALRARGHGNELNGLQLLVVSVIFGMLNVAVGLAVPLGGWVVGTVLELAGVTEDPGALVVGLFVGLFGVSVYWSGILLFVLLPQGIATAVMAVPMTAAAYSANSRSHGTRLFFGFGAGVPSLLVVTAVWLIGGHFFSIFGEVWTTLGLMVTALWAFVQGESLPWEITINRWSALGGTLFMTWASSWFFATAVLAWERKVESGKVQRQARIAERQGEAVDLRAMRARRMRGSGEAGEV